MYGKVSVKYAYIYRCHLACAWLMAEIIIRANIGSGKSCACLIGKSVIDKIVVQKIYCNIFLLLGYVLLYRFHKFR